MNEIANHRDESFDGFTEIVPGVFFALAKVRQFGTV
jgi:hypothetical protein